MKSISDFLRSSDKVFILSGYAGTGKTTVLKPIIEMAEKSGHDVRLMAPTGRAAKVMESKAGHDASTIHRAIYRLSGLDAPSDEEIRTEELEDMELRFFFPLDIPVNDTMMLCIVDEASMISSRYSRHELYKFGSGYLLDDLLSFALYHEHGKIIFSGDPAQLPPVGDNTSCALDPKFFAGKNIPFRIYTLTEVLRQNSRSTILANAGKIRSLIGFGGQRNSMFLEMHKGEFELVSELKVAESYCAASRKCGQSCAVVTFSNRAAQTYNLVIRKMLYGAEVPELVPGERLVVVQNNYSFPDRDIMNGDIAELVSASEKTVGRTVKVRTKDSVGETCEELVHLVFRDVTLRFWDGKTLDCKILSGLLGSDKPNLTVNQVKALFIDFCIRHPHLPRSSQEFRTALLTDSYYNAVKVKYGYAVTCHKAQGGEWDYVYVDFSQRKGLSDDVLRWDYTAVTRARKCVYAVNPPHVDCFSGMESKDVVMVRSLPEEVQGQSDSDFIGTKYSEVCAALSGTPYRIVRTEHKNYREIYHIASGGFSARFDATYNSKGRFSPFRLVSLDIQFPHDDADAILQLLNSASAEPQAHELNYRPSQGIAEKLYVPAVAVCRELGIAILKVSEHPDAYNISYCFRKDGNEFYVIFYFNSNGFVTSLAPFCVKGSDRTVVLQFIEKFKNHVIQGSYGSETGGPSF